MIRRPIVGISPGDPAGIGPEIALKALLLEDTYEICRGAMLADGHLAAVEEGESQ